MFVVGHASRAPWRQFHLLCQAKKTRLSRARARQQVKCGALPTVQRFNAHERPVAVLAWDALSVSAQLAGWASASA